MEVGVGGFPYLLFTFQRALLLLFLIREYLLGVLPALSHRKEFRHLPHPRPVPLHL
jgi:hypothetical protein